MAKTNKGRKFFATTATAALVASAIVPVASAAQVNDFNSIASYAQEAVQDLVDRGVVQGDANGNFQPRKSVSRAEAATILTGALGLETSENVYFTDVKSGAWYYDAINAAVNNGVFAGKGAGIFEPNGNLTRGEAAIILVNAFNLDGRASLAQFADEKSVKAWAVESLEIAVGNGVIKGDNGKIKANDAITKQDFAVMFSRAEAAADAVAAKAVKVINATTVEVTFPEAVTDLAKVDFAIDGLTISNKVVKQTDSKTVVLTTSAQEGGKVYTVTVDGKAVGKFTGIAEVIPTAINFETKSVQGVIGEEVTLTAKVTVPQGQSVENIPVTFNIVNDKRTNDKIEAEVLTKADGTATYKYTRYYDSEDTFTAYATKKSSVYSTGKVYWANALQLTVKDITEATTLVNGSKKVYEINQPANKGGYVFVAFQENLQVTPDKAERGAIIEGVNTYTINGNTTANIVSTVANAFPYSFTTGGTTVTAVKLDNAGKANLVVSGSNATVTPIIYSAEYKTDVNGNLTHIPAYTATALQAKASTAKFELKHTLGLTIKAEGVQNAATYKNATETGGRDYVVTYTDNAGKVAAPGTLVKIALPRVGGAVNLLNSDGQPVQQTNSDATNVYYELPVKAKGEVKFTVVSTNVSAYVAPIAFIDNGKKVNGVTNGVLDTDDLQTQGELTYFVEAISYSAALKALDAAGKPVSSVVFGGTPAYFTYELVDQNGKKRAYTQDTIVSFEVTAGTGAINVNGQTIEAGRTATVRNTIVAGQTSTNVEAYALTPSTITATATGSRAGVVLPSTNPTSVTVNFTQYGTTAITGIATNVDTALDILTINNVLYSYDEATYRYNNNVITKAAFEDYIKNNGATVSVTVDTEGKFTFNVIATTVPTKTPQDLVNEEAAKITTAPAIADNKLVLPTVPAGYTVAIKSTDKPAVISTDGTVTRAETAQTVQVVLEVKHTATGVTATAGPFTVTVPAKETETGGETVKADKLVSDLENGLKVISSIPGKYAVTVDASLLAPEHQAATGIAVLVNGQPVELTAMTIAGKKYYSVTIDAPIGTDAAVLKAGLEFKIN